MRIHRARTTTVWIAALSVALVATAVWARWPRMPAPSTDSSAALSDPRSQWIDVPEGNLTRLGESSAAVRVPAFRLGRCEVTNREFAQFVAATGYRTTAEQRGGGMVLDAKNRKWTHVPGASWRRPAGADSSIAGRDDYPVVQVSWFDAVAYAKWTGAELPTEIQWEHAARGEQRDAIYPWGPDERLNGRYRANYWQGWFPDGDLGRDGFRGLAPVGSFPATGAGFSDLGGNVWEWTASRYEPSPSGDERSLRGGSWTSAENFLPGYRIDVRRGLPPESAYQDVGFRVAQQQ